MRARKAFTLVELLVVMAIITILASMLLPSLGKAKEQALSIQCVNNVRQVGLALLMYGDDNGDWMPLSTNSILGNTGAFGYGTWTFAALPYYQNTNVLRCPALSGAYNKSGFSYFMGSMPFAVLASSSNTWTPASVRTSSIVTASLFPLSGDCNYPTSPTNSDLNNDQVDTLFGQTSPVHLHRVNILFADWHVKGYGKYIPSDITYSLVNPGIDYY